jgi:hypothetical protein
LSGATEGEREQVHLAGGTSAGQVTQCDDDSASSHEVRSVHIVVFCRCGCSFRSTDGSIALRMAERHIERQAVQP